MLFDIIGDIVGEVVSALFEKFIDSKKVNKNLKLGITRIVMILFTLFFLAFTIYFFCSSEIIVGIIFSLITVFFSACTYWLNKKIKNENNDSNDSK